MFRSKKSFYIFGGIVIALTCVATIAYTWAHSAASSAGSTSISERTRQFVVDHQFSGSPVSVDSLDATAETIVENQTATVETSCFATRIPFPVQNIQSSDENGECSVRGTAIQPRFAFTITSKPVEATFDILEHSGVSFRKKNAEEYTEVFFDQPAVSEKLLFQSQSELTLFYVESSELTIISFSNAAVIDERHHELLNTLFVELNMKQDAAPSAAQ